MPSAMTSPMPERTARRALPMRAMNTPASPPASSPPIGSAATAAPSSAFVRPSESLIAGSRGSTAAATAPWAKNSVLTAIRAARARAASMGGVMGGSMVPDVAAPPRSRPVARRRTAAGRVLSSLPMPELPEVETVARDLRRHLLPEGGGPGPAITGARVAWTRTLRDEDPDAFVAGVAGRRIEAIGRRGKQVVIDLSGGAFLTIHLKMTGQLFVVPAVAADRSLRAPRPRRSTTARELRFRDVRKFGRIGLYVADDDPFDGIGPEPLDDRVHAQGVPAAHPRPPGAAQAAARRPGRSSRASATSTPTRRCGARSSTRCGPRARSARPTSVRCTRHIREILAEAIERRGSSIDDYTAPDGDGAMQERLDVYQRTGEPCRRCGRPIRRIVIGIRATHFCSWCQRLPAAQRPAAAPLLRAMTPRPAPPRPAGGAGAGWSSTATARSAAPPTRRPAPGPARRARRRPPRPGARPPARGAAR